MSRAFDRAAEFLDQVVELLDNPTQESVEDEFTRVSTSGECWRCLRDCDDLGVSELCHECRRWLVEGRVAEPRAGLSVLPEGHHWLEITTFGDNTSQFLPVPDRLLEQLPGWPYFANGTSRSPFYMPTTGD